MRQRIGKREQGKRGGSRGREGERLGKDGSEGRGGMQEKQPYIWHYVVAPEGYHPYHTLLESSFYGLHFHR